MLTQAKTLARNRADWSPFARGELLAARSTLQSMSAPGEDGMTYEPFKASTPCWDEAILVLSNLCLHWGKVPSAWKRSLVVPIPKKGDPLEFTSWFSISLLACAGELLEALLLGRLHPVIDPKIAPTQAGFRWGADEQAWTLVETLRLGSSRARPCFAVFVDIRKAYDTV